MILRAVQGLAESDGMDRRGFLALAGVHLNAPAHQWLLERPGGDLSRRGSARVHAGAVEVIDAITAGLRRVDDSHGGGGAALTAQLHAHLRHVVELLSSGTYDDSTGKRLYASAAELLRLRGWTAFENGEHGMAQRCWIAALRAADTSGDRALAANILGFMSCQAKDLASQASTAVTLAETARSGYRGTSPRVAAILHLRAAEAYATVGDRRRCHSAIDAAFDSLDRSGDSPDWSYWIDNPAQVHAQAGFCHLRLGEAAQARHHLTQALTLSPDTDHRETALRHTLLTAAWLHLRQTDVEQAVYHAGHALTLLTGTVNSTRCAHQLAAVVSAAQDHNHQPALRVLRHRIQDLLYPPLGG
ncbi:hypothetical protein FB390_4970 [Nocardia bhagyanarayanae]|uniref:Uncharacterized protein n=2 Tax=Nocardia bhagyanarayanae TaxID=1215925 RepID=A0A543FHF0_9NOCA|nr:hypothetical protein FB390_4970 [Nocardia bhagyanarayanae]